MEINELINNESDDDELYNELCEANEPITDETNDTDQHNRVYEANESDNDKINNNIEFITKKELYDYYGIDVKTIPDDYEVKMRYNRINGKRGLVYKLVKK